MGVEERLRELEERLLTASVRRDAHEISRLLADEFREFGSSGRTFSKEEIVSLLQSEEPVRLSLKEFAACAVSDQAVLVTYRCVKEIVGLLPAESLRSSLWIYRDARWQMLFHQGTRIA